MGICKRIIAALFALALIVSSFYFFYLLPRYTVPILMYHSIGDSDDGDSMSVSVKNFTRQIAFLKENRYSIISLDRLVEGIKAGERFPWKTVVLTFDDGYENNYLYVFPILANANIPATIFLTTGSIGIEDKYLNWDEVRLMARTGIDFGGHTINHAYLPSINDTRELWDEIKLCKDDVERNIGKEANYFCYPAGGVNQKIKEAVRRAGFKGACTTNRGSDRRNRDVYELNRIKVTNSDMTKPFHFRAKLSGYYNFFRRFKAKE